MANKKSDMNTADFYTAFTDALATHPSVHVAVTADNRIRIDQEGTAHCPLSFVGHSLYPADGHSLFTAWHAAAHIGLSKRQAANIMEAADDFPRCSKTARTKLLAIIAPYLTQ